jgi:hypothetical protein
MNLENELRDSLRRKSPAPGFAGRVLARIEQDDARSSGVPKATDHGRRWRAVAASMTLAAVLAGYASHRIVEQRRIEGEFARDQVLLAMRIAGEKVRYAQQEVRAIGTDRTEEQSSNEADN